MSPNFPHMLSEQAEHVAYIVRKCLEGNIGYVEASAQAEQAWVSTILKLGESRRRFLENCTPGYYNNEGEVSEQLVRSFPFGAGPVAFIDLLRAWRAAGNLEGLEVGAVHVAAAREDAA